MEVTNCSRCGKIFTKIRNPLCPDCINKEEEDFQSLKDYIDENPACTMQELSDATNISSKRILGYIREGRLEISKGLQGELHCERCHKPIAVGRYCEACRISMSLQINDVLASQNKEDDGPKMYISTAKKL